MIDAHAHLDFSDLHDEIHEVLASAQKAGVTAIITAGYDHTHRERVDQLASIPGVYAAIGLHPWAVADLEDEDALARQLHVLDERLGEGSWCGLGECGLDYYRVKGDDKKGRRLQREAFIRQLEMAREHDLPAIIHAVQCHDDALSILGAHTPARGFQMHGYSGHASLIPRFAELGATFSFGSPLTWSGQKKIKSALCAAVEHDPGCWMLETDAPDRPVEAAQTHGLPAHLADVAHAAADILGWQVERVREVSAENASRFFGVEERLSSRQESAAHDQ